MPTYMDIHEIPGGVSADDVAKAHAQDINVQSKYGVSYHKYWVNEKAGKIFCLCHAPNAEAAKQVHREAHGLVAEKVIQVEPEVAETVRKAVEALREAGATVSDVKLGIKRSHMELADLWCKIIMPLNVSGMAGMNLPSGR